MVWAGFTYDYEIASKVIEGNTTAAKYSDEILRDVILSYQQAHPAENFIVVDDNATRDHAKVVTAYTHVVCKHTAGVASVT